MPAANTAKHMAYLKTQAKKAKRATVESPYTFFMVLNRTTKDAILHVEQKQAPTKFKSPAVIQQRLKKAKALDPTKYEDFFKSLKALVSCAGTVVYNAESQALIFTQTVNSGKGSKSDLQKALKGFRFISAEIADPPEPVDPPTVDSAVDAQQAALRAKSDELFRDGVMSAEALEQGFYDTLDSIDDLVDIAGALREELEDCSDPARRAALEARLAVLDAVIEKIDAWDDEDGIIGMVGGLNELLSNAEVVNEAVQDLIASTLLSIRALWKDGMEGARSAMASHVPTLASTAAKLKQEEQDTGEDLSADGLAKMANEEALVEALLHDIPKEVAAVLNEEADRIQYSVEILNDLIPQVNTFRISLSSNPIAAMFDEYFGTTICTDLTHALDQIARSLTNLQKQIA